jgi:O-methyltransferase involved in polyketide biosynthesis
MTDDSSRISPTAHYTGYIWYRNGLSHPAFATRPGWLLYQLLRPANAGYALTGGPTLEQMLLARHRLIDHLLDREVESGRIGQVVEIAAGLTPRGLRFTERHPDLVYVEADLPDMVRRKRAVLAGTGERPGHHLVCVDALADDGPTSLAGATAGLLDPGRGTAVITEGLLSYFDRATVEGIWARVVRFLRGFPAGVYLSDMHLTGEVRGIRGARAFQVALSLFARGNVHIHYRDPAACADALGAAGFDRATVHHASDWAAELGLDPGRSSGIVRVIEAQVEPAR